MEITREKIIFSMTINLKINDMSKYRVLQLIKELSAVNGILYIFNRLCSTIGIPSACIKYYLVAQSLYQEPLLPAGRGKTITIKELPVSYQHDHPCPRPIDIIQDRYKQGAVCLCAFKEQEFAGCLWYVKGRYQEDEVRCRYELVSDSSVWDFDVYVKPEYRLSPVFLKLWDEASERLFADGYRYSISRISAFNPISLSSHKRMGAKPLGWAVFLSVGFVQFTLSNLFPYLHFSFDSASFPVFKLNIPK